MAKAAIALDPTAGQVSKSVAIAIRRAKLQTLPLVLIGTTKYVQLRYTQKAILAQRAKMELGDVAKKNRRREARDYEQEYLDAMYVSKEDWHGIPAACFRNASISACRIAGFAMTKAKLSIFIRHDGVDASDGTPLVKIIGKPCKLESQVRNATGVSDLRVRAQWLEWKLNLRVEFDADQFSVEDIVNLFDRVGKQVGIGEGRHDSKESCGMGWGCFTVEKPGSVA